MKSLRHLAEAAFIYILIAFFSLLPPPAASAIGGFLGRMIGPRLAASRKAARHIHKIWPDCPPARRDQIIKGMWDNLGRTFAEYPHLEEIARNRCDIMGAEIVHQAHKTHGNILLFSGHIGNWEICPAKYYVTINTPVHLVYRAPNNPHLENLLQKMRSLHGKLLTIRKSRSGAKAIVMAARNKESLAILIDQKYNEGIPVPFLGWMAMTSTSPIANAQRYNMPIIPMRCIRLPNCRFRLEVLPPIPAFNADGSKREEAEVMRSMNDLLGQWIAEHPESWIWQHRRWSSKKVADMPRVCAAPPLSRALPN
ncbi:MAG: lipid A biosynthesis acyltransferase [Pseudomonadota bacterium]